MKPIKRKLLGVFACMLLLTMIPLSAGMTDTQPDAETESNTGRVWIRGLLFRCNCVGNFNHGLAIKLHYIRFMPSGETAGMVTMRHVIFKDSACGGRMYEVGLGLFTYVIGFFEGGLKIL